MDEVVDGYVARALFGFQSRLLTPAQVKAMPRPRYLIDGIIVENTLGLVWGPWGSCKTFLAARVGRIRRVGFVVVGA